MTKPVQAVSCNTVLRESKTKGCDSLGEDESEVISAMASWTRVM